MKTGVLSLAVIVILLACSSKNDPGKIYVLETMQKSARDAYGHGEMYLSDLREMAENKSESKEALSRVKKLYKDASHIDSLFGRAVYHIETLKIKLFKEIGVRTSKHNLIYLAGGELAPKFASFPNSYQFEKIKHTSGSELFNEQTIRDLKFTFKTLRAKVCKQVAYSANAEDYHKFIFIDPRINDFKDSEHFSRMYGAKMKHVNVPPDDTEVIKKIYFTLSKNEQFWHEVLTAKSDWTEVMQLLLSLENDILNARRDLLSSLNARIGCCADFGFTHILPVIDAPSAALAGDTIEYTVFMGAYDAERNPSFTTSQGTTLLQVNNGIGYFQTVVPSSGKVELKGTITIFNRSGIPKTSIWKRSVRVVSHPN